MDFPMILTRLLVISCILLGAPPLPAQVARDTVVSMAVANFAEGMLTLDRRLVETLENAWLGEPLEGCVYEVYILPQSRNRNMIAIRRIPYLRSYVSKHQPIVQFTFKKRVVFVYSGVDLYVRGEGQQTMQEAEGRWEDFPKFFKVYLDSLGTIKPYNDPLPYLCFPLVGRVTEGHPIPIPDSVAGP